LTAPVSACWSRKCATCAGLRCSELSLPIESRDQQEVVIAMHLRLSLAALTATFVMATSAFADCVTIHYRFFTRGDAVTTNESLLSGDTCFHTLRNNPRSGNIFRHLAVAQSPSHGTLGIGGSAFQYKSSQGYRGPDSYAVKICMVSPRGRGCSIVTFNAEIN